MLSHSTCSRQNILCYHNLPGGIIRAFAAKVGSNNSMGYVQLTIRSVNLMLQETDDDSPDPIALNKRITTVSPIHDPLKSSAKDLSFVNHTKIIGMMSVV